MQRTGALIVGQSGAGKNRLITNIIKAVPAIYLYLDVMGEVNYGVRFSDPKSLINYLIDTPPHGHKVLTYTPVDPEEDGDFAWRVFDAYPGRATVVCSEIDEYAGRSINKSVQSIMRRGRHKGKSFIFAAQNASSVNPDVRRQVDYIISLYQGMKIDRDWLAYMDRDKANMVSDLSMYKQTGVASQFIVFGPEDLNNKIYSSIIDMEGYTTISDLK